MRTLIIIAILTLGLATASAQTRQCSTQCYRTFNGSQCYTNCN